MIKSNELIIWIVLIVSLFGMGSMENKVQRQATLICDLEQRIINLEKGKND